MAQAKKGKKQPAKKAEAVDKKSTKTAEPSKKPAKKLASPKKPNFLRSIIGYFKGSWQEIRATKWPNRKYTASLTVAVLIFTAIIMLFIIALDYVFGMLFERIIS